MILTDEELDATLQPLGMARYSTLMGPADVNKIARIVESAVLRKLRERPADAYMRDGWGPDCGPYVELYKASEMGWRDKEGWTSLHIIPEVNE